MSFIFSQLETLRKAGKKFIYVSLEDFPERIHYYTRPYESDPISIFDKLMQRSDKQLMDHVRPSLLTMQIRIARYVAKSQSF